MSPSSTGRTITSSSRLAPLGVVHLVGLTDFKNRLAALFNWTVAFLGRGRPQRVITA
jgi:hypothetical protein